MTKERKEPEKKKEKRHGNHIGFDWSAFDALLQFKVTKKYCAEYLGMSVDTIERRIKERFDMTFTEYAKLRMQTQAVRLQQKAIKMALDGNTTMMIFALKNMAEWSDNNNNNSSSGDEDRVTAYEIRSTEGMTKEQIKETEQ